MVYCNIDTSAIVLRRCQLARPSIPFDISTNFRRSLLSMRHATLVGKPFHNDMLVSRCYRAVLNAARRHGGERLQGFR